MNLQSLHIKDKVPECALYSYLTHCFYWSTHKANSEIFHNPWLSKNSWQFPIDTPLVLRLVKTHMGKCLFSPELKSYLITQWNCTTIGSCRCRKRTNGSAAELHEPMATIRANIPAETGGASGYISGRFAIGSSDFFSFSDDDFVYADPEKPTRRWHASQ